VAGSKHCKLRSIGVESHNQQDKRRKYKSRWMAAKRTAQRMSVARVCELERSKHGRPQMKSRPSFALKAGHELQRCELLGTVALKRHDHDMLKTAQAFLKVRAYEWRAMVSGAALSSLSRQKQSRPDLIPCTEDVAQNL